MKTTSVEVSAEEMLRRVYDRVAEISVATELCLFLHAQEAGILKTVDPDGQRTKDYLRERICALFDKQVPKP